MSALLSCRELEKSFGPHALFSGLGLTFRDGERVGLIGPNGAGKSTLLKILAGLEPADGGEIALRKGARLGYLPQDETFAPGRTVLEWVDDALTSTALEPQERETRARIVLGKMDFADPSARAETLSGGWRKRLSLARVLALDPDLVLLDEPTNHLDIEGIEWLERLLEKASFASVVVTHDRYLLERVGTRVIEIGRHYPDGHFSSDGSYSAFLLQRNAFLDAQQKQERSLANTVRREVEWLRRGPQGRGTKAKGRIKAAHETMSQLDEVRARNRSRGTAEIDFSATGRKTRDLLVAEELTLARGERVLATGIGLRLGPGDRVGLVGPNGCGKTSLLRVIEGKLPLAGGTLRLAPGLKVVTFEQERERLDPDATLRDTLCNEGDTVHYQGKGVHVSAWAERFLFRREQLDQKVGALSGGEQARLLIADLIRQPADLLLLDEPTNDLDLPTREVLEDSLTGFSGALMLVTHDRYLLETVSTELLALEGGRGHALADLDQWRRLRTRLAREAREAEQAKRPKPAQTEPQRPVRKAKLNNKESRELEGMEAAIEAAEATVASLDAKTQDPEVLADHRALQEAYEALHRAQQNVETMFARWEELEAKKQGLTSSG